MRSATHCVTWIALLLLFSSAQATEAIKGTIVIAQSSGAACPQVISCGTKDGKRKEYPTACAAEEDGATDVEPKTGDKCDATE
jgi:hypothetical protein